MTQLIITLPLFPDETRPNSGAGRGHWQVKHRGTAEQRSQARVAALAAMNEPGAPYKPKWERAQVQLEYHRPNPRAKKQDIANLIGWAKASIDGLQDAEVFKNDQLITFAPPVELLGKEAREPKVVVIITPQE
jgi:Holliday junction resolvase RusA-like endonuclease